MNETNLSKIHIFPSEDSYNSNKESVGSSDLALVPNISITELSVSGRTITYTKGDGTTGTITTQDTSNGIVAQSLGTNGYVKFANGLILQWGTIASNTRETSVTFAISFKTVYSAVATVYASGVLGRDQQCATIYSVSTTGMKLGLYDNDQTGWYWVAIGK